MKINQLQENLTPASTPSVKTIAPKFGRSDEMLESDCGTTSAGSVASVSQPVGKMQRRGKGSMFAGIKTSAKYPNSAAVKEGRFDNRDAYQRDYDSSVTGFGRKEREDDEFNPEYDDRMRRQTGMIFYNVTDPQKAQELGLKQTRTGKWYIRTGNRLAQQVADKAFGPGKIWYPKNESVDEVAPPGAKAERMVKHIKAGYAKDGKLTDKEKAIAYATAWKAHNAGKVEEEGMAEASPETTFNVLKGLKTWQVVIFNNYYAGKYSDYRGRYYYVLAHSPEEAKQVVLDNADGILQDILSMKSHNGKRILPPSKAVPITSGRIGKIEDGTVAGRMSTAGFKKMFGPQGPMMVKLSGGNVVDIQGQEQGVAEEAGTKGYRVTWSEAGSDKHTSGLLLKPHAIEHAKMLKKKPGTSNVKIVPYRSVEEEKQRLDPKCWKGYRKAGTKMKGGVRVNNCVPIDEAEVVEDKLASDLYRDLQIFKKGADKDIGSKAKDREIGNKPQDKDILTKEDWQKVNQHDNTDGMSDKAVKAYRRENPGSKLKTAVTTKPSKLKAGSKDAKRRKSFCARMSGVKGPMKDEHGKPTAKAKALKRWNC